MAHFATLLDPQSTVGGYSKCQRQSWLPVTELAGIGSRWLY